MAQQRHAHGNAGGTVGIEVTDNQDPLAVLHGIRQQRAAWSRPAKPVGGSSRSRPSSSSSGGLIPRAANTRASTGCRFAVEIGRDGSRRLRIDLRHGQALMLLRHERLHGGEFVGQHVETLFALKQVGHVLGQAGSPTPAVAMAAGNFAGCAVARVTMGVGGIAPAVHGRLDADRRMRVQQVFVAAVDFGDHGAGFLIADALAGEQAPSSPMARLRQLDILSWKRCIRSATAAPSRW